MRKLIAILVLALTSLSAHAGTNSSYSCLGKVSTNTVVNFDQTFHMSIVQKTMIEFRQGHSTYITVQYISEAAAKEAFEYWFEKWKGCTK